MAKKSDQQQLKDLMQKQKELQQEILKLENKQLLRIGKSAKQYQLTEWNEKSLIKAFEHLKETGEEYFMEAKKDN